MNVKARYLMMCSALSIAAAGAAAQNSPANVAPSLPPRLRTPSAAPAASGQALRNEAMQKLQRRFEEADLDVSGSLTRDEAERAGLGYVAGSFDQIDSAGRGKVSFAAVRRFMQQRRQAATQVQQE